MRPPNRAWSLSGPLITGLFAILMFVGGFGSWAATAQLSGAIIAPGHVIASRVPQFVQHEKGGRVAKVFVSEGDTVKAGDALIALDETALVADLVAAKEEQFDLRIRTARIEAELSDRLQIEIGLKEMSHATFGDLLVQRIKAENALIEARVARVAQETHQRRQKIAQTESLIKGLRAQTSAIQSQLRLIEAQLNDQLRLKEQGLSPASRVAALQREAARLAGAIADIDAQIDQAQGFKQELMIEGDRMSAERKERLLQDLVGINHQSRILDTRIAAIEDQRQMLRINAPASGTIHRLSVVGEGMVVQPGQPILQIVPNRRPARVRVDVDPQQIGDVVNGQQAQLSFLALSGPLGPLATGRVIHISADRLQNSDGARSHYAVEIEITSPMDGRDLIPGLPVRAFIKTQTRTPLSYLLQPFTDYLSKAMREG
ncbi:HlyD family type I secretion periplasmic adaptor subunit [Pseudooceanicola sp. MF1-13]|uniref:HlyD family type I secretion periplasmic adaptor subunit n=1 Tax=Pseudooceanicola sp. MF1-13 TaxID=3379095 RepID=UPI003891B73F